MIHMHDSLSITSERTPITLRDQGLMDATGIFPTKRQEFRNAHVHPVHLRTEIRAGDHHSQSGAKDILESIQYTPWKTSRNYAVKVNRELKNLEISVDLETIDKEYQKWREVSTQLLKDIKKCTQNGEDATALNKRLSQINEIAHHTDIHRRLLTRKYASTKLISCPKEISIDVLKRAVLYARIYLPKSANKNYGLDDNIPPEKYLRNNSIIRKKKAHSNELLRKKIRDLRLSWEESKVALTRDEKIQKIADVIINSGPETAGNCIELSYLVMSYLLKHWNGNMHIDMVQLKSGDHIFVIIHQIPDAHGLYPKDFSKWGKGAWVLDAWANLICKAQDYITLWQAKMDEWQAKGLLLGGNDSPAICKDTLRQCEKISLLQKLNIV